MSDAETPTAIYVPPANIPPPKPLVFDDNLAAGWKTWKKASKWHGRRNCPAFGKKCSSCSLLNHLEKMCRSKNVSVVQEDSDSESDSPYVISVISKNKKKFSKAKVATTKLYINKQRTENIVKIQIDTGAQCNILPVETYIKVTGDTHLKSVKERDSIIHRREAWHNWQSYSSYMALGPKEIDQVQHYCRQLSTSSVT